MRTTRAICSFVKRVFYLLVEIILLADGCPKMQNARGQQVRRPFMIGKSAKRKGCEFHILVQTNELFLPRLYFSRFYIFPPLHALKTSRASSVHKRQGH